jgi:hypothetical protein
MKKIYLTITFAALILISSNWVKAQTASTKLNQLELMKQLSGKWQCNLGKDTIYIYDTQPYGTGLIGGYTITTKNKIITEGKALIGYDKEIDKIIFVYVEKGKDIALRAIWFTSKNHYLQMDYKYVSNPESAPWRIEAEIRPPDTLVENFVRDNKIFKVNTFKLLK